MNTISDLKQAMAILGLGTKDTLEVLGQSNTARSYKRFLQLKGYRVIMTPTQMSSIYLTYKHVPKQYSALKEWELKQRALKKLEKTNMNKPAKGYIVVNTTDTPCSEWNARCSIPSNRRPTVVHLNKQTACDEATRLAKENEGSTFMVFETCAAFSVEQPVTRYDY